MLSKIRRVRIHFSERRLATSGPITALVRIGSWSSLVRAILDTDSESENWYPAIPAPSASLNDDP